MKPDRVTATRLAGVPLLRALSASWRVRELNGAGEIGPPRRRLEPAVYALWHAELLPLALLYAPVGLATLISHHRDGEIAANLVEGLGARVVRGSSTSGGSKALRAMARLGMEGWPLAITPDGPRGPAGRSKPGVVRLAARCGLPVVPVAAQATAAWRLRSWDRFIVPKPFTVVHVEFAAGIRVPPDAEAELSSWLERIDRAISAASERCARRARGEAT